MAKQRTLLSLDYSGSGETVDDEGELTLQKLASEVVGVTKAAGLNRFDIVGHSLGAAVVIEIAARHPDLIRSMVVVTGFAFGSEPRLQLQFELWLDLLRMDRSAFLRLLLLSGLTPAFISRVGLSDIKDMIDGYMPVANWNGIRRQVELDLAVDVREQALRVRSPTLVVPSTHDQIVTECADLAARIPNAKLRRINAGHLAYFEGGDEFVSVLSEFLRQQET